MKRRKDANGDDEGYAEERTRRFDIVGYASPLVQVIFLLASLLILHALVTSIFMLLTLSPNVVYEFYFIAQKSFHVFLPFFGASFAAMAYQRSLLEMTNKTAFLDFRLLLCLITAGALLAVDCVFFGKDTVPTLMSCYNDAIPPPGGFCDTQDEKTAYTAVTALRAAHIIAEALIIVVALAVRCVDNGDQLYHTTTEELHNL